MRNAGSSMTVKMMTMKITVTTRARGYSTTYAPSTPATAPDAPTMGTVASGSMSTCAASAANPPSR